VAFLFGFELLAVPLVEFLKLLRLLIEVPLVSRIRFLLHLEPIFFSLVEQLPDFIKLLVFREQVFMMPGLLLVKFIDMDLLRMRCLLLLLLNILHQLVDLALEAFLELLFHLGVLFDASCRLCDDRLELFAGVLRLLDVVLILSHVLLQVVEDLEFLVEGDQSVELVLKLLLLFLEQKLEVGNTTLLQHRICIALTLAAIGGHGRHCALG